MRLSKLASLPYALLLLLLQSSLSSAVFCSPPAPAFPPPDLSDPRHASLLRSAQSKISAAVLDLTKNPIYEATTFSLEVTSQTETLFGFHHTADKRSELRRGAETATNLTCYRIASMTKPFTVLALFQLYEAGKLALDDSILKYLPDLSGILPWKDITIRSLASQNTGLPRDFAQSDLINEPDVAAKLGLPQLNPHSHDMKSLPTCDEMVNYTRSCNASDLLEWVAQLQPMYAPNQQSSYSNINFDLLGLVIANASAMPYEDYVTTHILRELDMTNLTGFTTPPDEYAAIAKGIEFYWPFAMGVQNPTGGLYANSADLSTWLRYVLSTYNAHANGALNWFNPTSFSGNLRTFYGTPWEILRASTADVINTSTKTRKQANMHKDEDEIIDVSTRPLTFITKGGGLPAYTSNVIMIPEYGLGITILVAGEGKALASIRDIAINELATVAEQAALRDLQHRYAGTFALSSSSDSSADARLTLTVSPRDGLHLTSFHINSTDITRAIGDFFDPSFDSTATELVLHLVPTQLYVDQAEQRGERWRVVPLKRRRQGADIKPTTVWDEMCVADVDVLMYAGEALNEVVFWGGEDEDGRVREVEMTGWRLSLARVAVEDGSMAGVAGLGEQMGQVRIGQGGT